MPLIYHVITDKAIGGAGLFLLRLLSQTDKARFPSLVILPRGSALLPLYHKQKIDTLPICEAKEASFSFSLFFALSRLFRKAPPDILHTHGALAAKLAAKLTTDAAILSTRHCDTPFSSRPTSRFLYRRLTDATVCPSLCGLSRLAEAGIPSEELFYIPNGFVFQGVPTEAARRAARQKYGVAPSDIAIGLCGRLEKIKGHQTVLPAAKRVLQKNGRFLFLFLGEGGERRKLTALAEELGIAERVRFLGHSEEVTPFYHALDAHVSASFGDETASLSVAEGMSAGLPTLVSACGGNLERLGKGGLTFPVGDAAALSSLLLSLGSEAVRARLSAAALERAKALPSFAKTAEAYAALYLRLLKKGT